MTISKRNDSDSSKCADIDCNTDCACIKNNNVPFGITIIPGSGKLMEFPASNNTLDCTNDTNNFLDCIINADICPKAFPPTNICVRDCTEFAAISQINFINGDLIIGDPEVTNTSSGLLQILPSSNNELVDILPNLLGINGSLYIIGTQYGKISGFDKLRFVTGSIVIVNNSNLISIPTFPSLLNVGGQITIIPPISSGEEPNTICGRGAIIIANNASLRKITGFEALRQVKDGIFIADNLCLSHICGFIHLYRTDRIVIKGNSKLSKVIGFCYTDTINIGLYIFDNNLDGDFDLVINAFIALETIGELVIVDNNSLKSLQLNALRIVINDFIVRSNSSLGEIVSSVQFVSNLYIENNKSLQTIKFPNLQEVNHILNINGNCAILSLDTFDELRRVGSGIMIAENKQLVELKGFNKLKYIGSNCISNSNSNMPTNSPCGNCSSGLLVPCGCIADITFDWTTITRSTDCVITDDFLLNAFDSVSNSCAYLLPEDFFKFVCNPLPSCNEIIINQDIPEMLSYSLIIFKNSRLRAIGGFCNLKHVNSNIYIINNTVLHTINAFGQLAFALDIWIRNNVSLKYIIGFSNLLSVRDFVVYESTCLNDLNNLKSLEFAQDIAIESRTAKSVKLPKTPIPSVLGYNLYFSFDTKC